MTTRALWKRLSPRKRCLIPADRYFEWHRNSRQPFRITLTDRPLFAFAGLYDTRKTKDGSETLHSCTILTCAANDFMAPIHDRMPIILSKEAEAVWLNRTLTDPEYLMTLL